jgi:hypothetical protein
MFLEIEYGWRRMVPLDFARRDIFYYVRAHGMAVAQEIRILRDRPIAAVGLEQAPFIEFL